MKVTDALLGEHGVFYAQFDHIETTLWKESRPEVVRALAAMLAAALAPHARIEDELLFDPVSAEIGGATGPMAVMRLEHDAIEGLLDSVAGAEGERGRDLLLEAIRLARAHFEKEERIAFPLVERVLGEEMLRALSAEWASGRNVLVG